MRDREDAINKMAVYLHPEHDRPSPKVWQPWYIGGEDSPQREGGGKELPSRMQRDHRMRGRQIYARPNNMNHSPSHPTGGDSEDEIDVVDTTSPPSSLPQPQNLTAKHSSLQYYPAPAHSPLLPQPYAPHALLNAYYVSQASGPPVEEEAPLDMSMKKPRSSPSPPPPHPSRSQCSSPPPAYTFPSQRVSPPLPNISSKVSRPSVITMVPPPQHSPEHPSSSVLPNQSPHAPPPPPPYSVATAQLRQRSLLQPLNTNDTAMAMLPKKKRIVQTKISSEDPEIEEHFRRSLGTTYHHIFDGNAPPPPSSSPPTTNSRQPSPLPSPTSSVRQEVHAADGDADKVDDHFAKALGSTWTVLKARTNNTPPPSYPTTSALPSYSSATNYSSNSSSATITRVNSATSSPSPPTSSNASAATITRVVHPQLSITRAAPPYYNSSGTSFTSRNTIKPSPPISPVPIVITSSSSATSSRTNSPAPLSSDTKNVIVKTSTSSSEEISFSNSNTTISLKT